MELFVIIVIGWKPLTIITKYSILDAAAVLDLPLKNFVKLGRNIEETIRYKSGPEGSDLYAEILYAEMRL